MTSANFLELSVLMPVSPRDINATIRKNNATVMNVAKAPPARNLLYSKALFIKSYKGASALFIGSVIDFSTPSMILFWFRC